MTKRARYSEYKDRYANFTFELSDEGILFMQCHTNGDSLVWSWEAHDGMSEAFADIAGDREIKVLIHTGTGENYNANWGAAPGGSTTKPIYLAMDGQKFSMQLDEKAWYGRMLVENILAVEVPVISAVNGPCSIHAEVPLLSDIVLASDTAYFQDFAHFPRAWCRVTDHTCSGRCSSVRTVPDRCSSWARSWARRRRSTGAWSPRCCRRISSSTAAWEIARDLALRPPLVLRYTRQLFMQRLQASIPRRVGSRARARDVCPASVLPSGRRHARTRPCLGSGTLVRLTTRRNQLRNLAGEPGPELRDAAEASGLRTRARGRGARRSRQPGRGKHGRDA